MKITKFDHSCLLVEMSAPINRTALFDPGTMSEGVLDVDTLEYLDDIIITHEHQDHFSLPLVRQLHDKFPMATITSTKAVVELLANENIPASNNQSDGITFFDAPHEVVEPMFPTPEAIGVHYLDLLTHPGDSHHFDKSRTVLALPVTAPWGATVMAAKIGIALQPKYIVPIHDWHWKEAAREQMYDGLEQLFKQHDITFLKPENGVPISIEV
jgi:L-ascorbate metabolism protein UlaG (beta-lactamase superfamily)